MSDLPTIPTPANLRWREFRIRGLPVLVVVTTACACVLLWARHAAPMPIAGEVEAIRANVSSRINGTILRLDVTQFSTVRAGEAVAQVLITDPRVLESTLAVVRAEVELLRASADPVLNRERTQLDYERLRLNLIDQRALNAANRVRLQFADAEVERVSRLHRAGSMTNVASQTEYELIVRDRDALRVEIEERNRILDQIEGNLALLRSANATNALGADADTLRAAVDLQEQKLRLAEAELSPLTISSPIEGTVSVVYRRAGENVVAGEPIITVTAAVSDRIVAFMLPPLGTEPKVGMKVQVRSRTQRRAMALTQITDVSPAMDLVPPTLLNPINNSLSSLTGRSSDAGARMVQVGLPFAMSLPPGLGLRPGELVDLTLVP